VKIHLEIPASWRERVAWSISELVRSRAEHHATSALGWPMTLTEGPDHITARFQFLDYEGVIEVSGIARLAPAERGELRELLANARPDFAGASGSLFELLPTHSAQ
jgi:hypothetical protein